MKMRSVGRTVEEKKSCLPSHSSRHIGSALTSVPAMARAMISSGFIAAIRPAITALFGNARNRFLWCTRVSYLRSIAGVSVGQAGEPVVGPDRAVTHPAQVAEHRDGGL